MVTLSLSDRQAHQLVGLLADHLNTPSNFGDVLPNAFIELHDAYNAQSVIPLISRDILTTSETCRAHSVQPNPLRL
jgi:hypothetical protein